MVFEAIHLVRPAMKKQHREDQFVHGGAGAATNPTQQSETSFASDS